MRQSLSGVPETLLIPLWARAVETKGPNPIIRDEKAVEMMSQIDYDFSKFDGSWMSQTGVAIRTEILDREAEKFIHRHPEAVIDQIPGGMELF
jgi:O-methyltransferase involved in polyketide biosynthesis